MCCCGIEPFVGLTDWRSVVVPFADARKAESVATGFVLDSRGLVCHDGETYWTAVVFGRLWAAVAEQALWSWWSSYWLIHVLLLWGWRR
jgi:hypothetical protein